MPTRVTNVTGPTEAGAGLTATVGVAIDTGVAPAGKAVTVMVNVWASPTSFVSVAGVTFASVLMFMEMGFWNALLDASVELVRQFNGQPYKAQDG